MNSDQTQISTTLIQSSVFLVPVGQDFPQSEVSAPSMEILVQKVHDSFTHKNRERITLDLINEVVSKLNIADPKDRKRTPIMKVHRLRFAGTKTLTGSEPQSIDYDQTFSGGVNIILIPDNDVGKSSIQKTIKFALTGDDSDYDADVKTWINRVWLYVYIDRALYTIHLSREERGLRGIISLGEEERTTEESDEVPNLLFSMVGTDDVKGTLERFFFQKLGFRSLSWTQRDPSSPSGIGLRSTSWRTYFQGLLIPDSSDHYLICDPQHATGNQDGLILSEFLGLRLTETLNALGVEASTTKREEEVTAEAVSRAEEQVKQLMQQLQDVKRQVTALESAQFQRRAAYETEAPIQKLFELGSLATEKLTEKAHLEQLREELNGRIRQFRSQARHIREAIELELQFTGLSVSLCPNCDNPVAEDAVVEENASHSCRLCGKQAHAASEDDMEAMKMQAETYDDQVRRDEEARGDIGRQLTRLSGEVDGISIERQSLQEVVQRGISYVLPSGEEQAARSAFDEQIGRLKAEISAANQRGASHQTNKEATDLRLMVVKRVREVLQAEASRMNETILARLSHHTEQVVRHIGAESITNLTCSALGRLSLKKNQTDVPFSRINNTGERLRVKLAFFLAMMRLGREPGIGRHPGFLMIDQPASAEMVPEDVAALASVFRAVDERESDSLQIILFTARREFQSATSTFKIYGPKAQPFAF